MSTEGADVDADVIVVGARPTGLMDAGDLAEMAINVLVLVRRPARESNLTRAFVVLHCTLARPHR
jgi:ribulose 1,5-bisphosphate synthetase/thiazole synthase